MLHPHRLLSEIVFVELEDVHVEQGLFVDSEHGLTTALLVGRCKLCGLVFMPIEPIPPHDDLTLQTTPTLETPQLPPWGERNHHVPIA